MPPLFIELDSIEKLDDLFTRSHREPVLIFKHSSTCGISSMVYRRLNEYDGEINLIVVQEDRDISEALADRTGVRHQSPQAIVLKNGKASYKASHYEIGAENIAAEMAK
jgi:bacillithiol system protein YtxJ